VNSQRSRCRCRCRCSMYSYVVTVRICCLPADVKIIVAIAQVSPFLPFPLPVPLEVGIPSPIPSHPITSLPFPLSLFPFPFSLFPFASSIPHLSLAHPIVIPVVACARNASEVARLDNRGHCYDWLKAPLSLESPQCTGAPSPLATQLSGIDSRGAPCAKDSRGEH